MYEYSYFPSTVLPLQLYSKYFISEEGVLAKINLPTKTITILFTRIRWFLVFNTMYSTRNHDAILVE